MTNKPYDFRDDGKWVHWTKLALLVYVIVVAYGIYCLIGRWVSG